MKLGVIGGGAMGEAIVAAVIRGRVRQPNEIEVAERYRERAEAVAREHGVAVTDDNLSVARGSDVLILAVKPHEFEKAAAGLGNALAPTTTVVSIMAGVTLQRLGRVLEHEAIVRSIPNTPAQVGEGMTVWTCGTAVDVTARERVASIFRAMGREVFVADEAYIDMATALSGSGPAYVFLFIEALVDAGVHMGLPRDVATSVALQTVTGSGIFARETGKDLAELRHNVTSPGGTTAAGLHVLEGAGFRATITEAVLAAYNRSKELGKGEPGK